MRSLLNSVFVRLSLAALLASMVFSLLLHLPGFLIDLGASEFDIGVLYAVSAAVAIALSPWMGRVVDRRGSRSVIIAASLVNALVLLAYITIDWFGVTVFLVRIANTSAQIFLFTAFLTFAAAVIPESRRTQGLALFGIAFLVPIGLGSLLGDGILAIANFDALFAVAALFVLGSISMVVTLSEPRIENHRPRRSFFAALRQDDLRPLWWLMFFFAFGATSVFTFMRTFIDATGYASVGLYFGVFAATAVLIRLSASSLPDVVGQKLVLVPAVAVYVAGFLFLAAAGGTTEVVVAATLGGAGYAFILPILSSFIVSRCRASERGSAMAILVAFSDLTILVGGPIVGAIIEASGYPTAWATIGVLVALGTVVFLLWDGAISSPALEPDAVPGEDPTPAQTDW